MSPGQVLELLRRQPFSPLVFEFSNEDKLRIEHPELVLVGHNWLEIGIPAKGESLPIAMHTKFYSLGHLVSVEPEITSAAS